MSTFKYERYRASYGLEKLLELDSATRGRHATAAKIEQPGWRGVKSEGIEGRAEASKTLDKMSSP